MNGSIAACTFVFPGRTVQQGIAEAASLGVQYVDIGAGGANAHWDTQAILQNGDRLAKETCVALQVNGVHANECFALDFGAPNNSPNQDERRYALEQFPRLADFAAAVGCNSVMQLAGPIHESLGRTGAIQCAAETLSAMAEIAAARGLAMHIEPDCGSCVNEPEYVAEFCRLAPDVKLTLDYSHFICQGFSQTDVEPLHRFAGHVHVRQASPGQIVSDVDRGVIDMARLVSTLRRDGYAGLFSVEYLYLPLTSEMDVMDQNRRMIQQLNTLLESEKAPTE